ncbi:VanZ family protein [Tessaracoccus caeni]|uniref:VanZ family protein n=1 Tax=Tessaracoccus caeni TaxID=3031239 RepID=UPI0023DC6C28|nr:VanZ family protein [Tessaracoccus caeni]MDF1488395.1 VanZ family protein [Tessaracoccus caeni]
MSDFTLARGETVASELPLQRTHALLVGLFVVYLVLLTWIILWKLEIPFVGSGNLRRIKLVPFAASGSYGASDPLEVGINILLFLPLGTYLGLLRPSWTLWKHAGTIAAASLLLEAGQYTLMIGSTDVTDVIANTAGGVIGVLGIAVMRRAGRLRVSRTARILLVGTVLAVLACLVFFASPVRYVLKDVPLTP